MTLIDTHTHLDFADFDADRAQVLDNCLALGVQRMVCSGCISVTGSGCGS